MADERRAVCEPMCPRVLIEGRFGKRVRQILLLNACYLVLYWFCPTRFAPDAVSLGSAPRRG